MRVARIVAVVLLLALWGALPALACLLPQSALSPAEMKCCAQMAGNCSGKMQASHSCCKLVANQGAAVLTATTQAQPRPLATMGSLHSQDSSQLASASTLARQQRHPPPESPPTLTTVLRI